MIPEQHIALLEAGIGVVSYVTSSTLDIHIYLRQSSVLTYDRVCEIELKAKTIAGSQQVERLGICDFAVNPPVRWATGSFSRSGFVAHPTGGSFVGVSLIPPGTREHMWGKKQLRSVNC